MTSPVGNWNYPTSIRFGAGRIAELPQACRELGMTRPLLVTDPGLAALPLVGSAVALCEEAGLPVAVFSDVKGNPTGENVDAGTATLRAGGHDGVIAFGGGSALDAAKAIALMAGQTRPLWDFEDRADWYTRVDVHGMVPVVAVPTTAGTGSEVGRASVITDSAEHVKKIIFHARMLPGRVIADPALTVGLPRGLTAATGVDALSHLLEAWCAPGFHPQADGIALEGMRLVQRSLVQATREPGDLKARADMLAASLMGATAFQKGLGAMHALSHPVGAVTDAHHGLCNAVFMPYVLAFNGPAIVERLDGLARYLGLSSQTGAGPEAVLNWVLALRSELRIPHGADALGVTQDLIEQLAAMAVEDPSAGGNPVPLDVAATRKLLQAALAGDVDAARR
jgi:alcohol dehydrogenase class IV